MQSESAAAAARHVYKVLRADEPLVGVYAGSPLDRRDGFVHLSPAGAVQSTVELYFAKDAEAHVLGFAVADLGAALKWEVSRDGLLFPHLFAAIDLDKAVVRRHMKRTADGSWEKVGHLAA